MLEGEMDAHLGYAKHATEGYHSGKILKGEHGEMDLTVPRDRNGEFEPQVVGKGQTRMPLFNDKIIALYARGMSTRDIVATLLEMYDVEVSPTLISQVTAQVLERVQEWQSRPFFAPHSWGKSRGAYNGKVRSSRAGGVRRRQRSY